jgi:hypothetical protein
VVLLILEGWEDLHAAVRVLSRVRKHQSGEDLGGRIPANDLRDVLWTRSIDPEGQDRLFGEAAAREVEEVLWMKSSPEAWGVMRSGGSHPPATPSVAASLSSTSRNDRLR